MFWKKVGVIGAGTMGQAISEMLAKNGLDVYIIDKNQDNVDAGRRMIELSLDKQIEKWAITESEKKTILSRIQKAGELFELKECDLIIEAIVEDLESKKNILEQMGRLCHSEVVIASNTSTLSITEIARAVLHPERVIGIHFIFPVSNIDVVEIVRGLQTSDQTYNQVKQFVEHALEKTGILVYESPGYVTTRLISIIINEALHVLAEGVASAEDIDKAMRIGYGFRHGPLEMADRFGLDSVLATLERMFRDYGDMKYRPAVLLRKLVRAGQLGTKTGSGFFRYDEDGDRI